MAYMNQERKAELAKEIAKVMPTNWKHTLRVHHHSTLVLTIRQAEVDLIGADKVWQNRNKDPFYRAGGGPNEAPVRPLYINLNEHHLDGHFDGKMLKIFQSIRDAMMVGNHDRSDVQSDYFDVGWYIDINIGEFDSPFVYARKKGAKKFNRTKEMAAVKKNIAKLEK